MLGSMRRVRRKNTDQMYSQNLIVNTLDDWKASEKAGMPARKLKRVVAVGEKEWTVRPFYTGRCPGHVVISAFLSHGYATMRMYA